MRKWFLLILVFCFIITGIVGCGSDNGAVVEKSTEPDSKSSDKDTNDDIIETNEPLEISMTLYRGPKTEDTWMQEEMEKRLGVKFDFIMLPGADEVKTKTNLLMSDPDTMPDVLWWTGQDKEFQQWIDAGLIVDMMPYLKEHGDNILGYYSEETIFLNEDEGKMYKLPGDVAEPSCMTTYIRKDWLDNLNLEVPTTIDEYIEVLRAFTFDDPNQSGQDDTYGFSNTAREWRSFAPFLYPYKAQPDDFVVTDDGTVKHGSVMPEMKEGLKVISEAYQEGLIDPTILTSNDLDELVVNGKFGSIYRWIAWMNPSATVMNSFKTNFPDGELIPIEAIKGPDGFASDEPEDLGGWCYVSITSAAEDPEEVFKVLDKMAESEFYKFRKWGEEGEHYELVDGTLHSLVDPEDAPALGLDLLADFFNRKDESNIDNSPETIELFNKRAETSQPLRKSRVRFKDTNRPMWLEYGAELNDLRDEIFYGIIAGDYPIDDFDRYVEQFYELGGDKVEAEANEFYSKQLEQQETFNELYEAELRR